MPAKQGVARQDICQLLWLSMPEPRDSLRQALYSLRRSFGAECFCCEGEQIAVVHGHFNTDVVEILQIEQALQGNTTTHAEAEVLLARVFALVKGRFLEGCIDCSEDGYAWMLELQAQVHRHALVMLARYCDVLMAQQRYTLAFAVAKKIVLLAPNEFQAVLKAVDIGARAGVVRIDKALDLEPAMYTRVKRSLERHRNVSAPAVLTAIEIDRVIQQLSERDRSSLSLICRIPSPFCFSLAMAAARISRTRLNGLISKGLIKPTGGGEFSAVPYVRLSAIMKLKPSTERRFIGRLCTLLLEWVMRGRHEERNTDFFYSDSSAREMIKGTIEAAERFELTVELVELANYAARFGFYDELNQFRAWVGEAVRNCEQNYVRVLTYNMFANIDFCEHNFARSAEQYELAFSLCLPEYEEYCMLLSMLPLAMHHAGREEEALGYSKLYVDVCFKRNNISSAATAVQFQAEMLRAAGRISEAMHCLREASILFEKCDASPLSVAECNYQLAATLLTQQMPEEALNYSAASYEARKQHNDTTGMGQCAVQFAMIAAARGSFAEAIAHIDYALHLFNTASKTASHAAALITRGDILRHIGNYRASQADYEQALAYWRSSEHAGWISTCIHKLASINGESAAPYTSICGGA